MFNAYKHAVRGNMYLATIRFTAHHGVTGNRL